MRRGAILAEGAALEPHLPAQFCPPSLPCLQWFREAAVSEDLNDNVKLDYHGRIQIFTYVLPFAYVLLLHDGALEGDNCHGGHAFLAATTGL